MRTVQMRVHPGTGLQFQDVFLFVQRPDAREGRVEVANDRFCAAAQKLFRANWLGKSSAHIGTNARLMCLRGANFLRLLPILDVGAYSIPSDDISRLIMQRCGANQKPAIFAVETSQPRFKFTRLAAS